MLSSNVSFSQYVRTDGYEWQEAVYPRTGRPIPALIGDVSLHQTCPEASWEKHFESLDAAWKGEPRSGVDHRLVNIEAVPDLYRKLAKLPVSKDSIQEFAGKYGFLGITETIVVEEGSSTDGSGWSKRQSVEFGCDWAREITVMDSALQVLDALDGIIEEGEEDLRRWFFHHHGSWHASSKLLQDYTGQGRAPWIDLGIWAGDDASILSSIQPDDIQRAATEFLRILASKQMRGRVSAYSVWDDVETKTTLTFKPDTLLGAIWLQFARALTRAENMRICIECGILFEFARKSRMFCSEACQKRYSRRKARQAARQ